MSSAKELRDILFETMRDVRAGKMDKDQAKAIADLGQTIINTAKVEVEAMRHGNVPVRSTFLEGEPTVGITHQGNKIERINGVTRHKLNG